MADIHITDELADRIRREAEAANMDIEELLDSRFPPKQEPKSAPVTLGALATALRNANIRTDHTDTAARFEDILDEEYADDLRNDQNELGKDDPSNSG